MSNNLQLNGIGGIKPNNIELKEPTFLSTIRNPLDLWLEESIPASLYQWITGNTKKKKAQEALDFLRRNADQPNTPEYKTAERTHNRFGYLLEEGGDFDFSEFTKLIKQHPGLVGAEFINAILADPYLIAVPFFGWGKLGRATVNTIRKTIPGKTKILKNIDERAILPDLAVGSLQALSLPLFYSVNYQLSENRTLSGPRTTAETTIGATAAMLFAGVYHGTAGLVSKIHNRPFLEVSARAKEIIRKNPKAGQIDPKTGKIDLIEQLHKDFKAKDFELPKHPTLNATKKIVKEEANAQEALKLLKLKADLSQAYDGANVLAKNSVFKKAAPYLTAGGIVGAAQFLTADDEKLVAAGTGVLYGAGGLFAIKKAFGFLNSRFKILKTPNPEEFKAVQNLHHLIIASLGPKSKGDDFARLMQDQIRASIPDAQVRSMVGAYFLDMPEDFFIKNFGVRKAKLKELQNISDSPIAIIHKQLQKSFKDAEILAKENNLIKESIREYFPRILTRGINETDDMIVNRIFGESGKFGFGQTRKFPRIQDALDAGYTPATFDVAQIAYIYHSSLNKAITNRAIINILKNPNIGRIAKIKDIDIYPVEIASVGKDGVIHSVTRLPFLINEKIQYQKYIGKIGKNKFNDMYKKFDHPYLQLQDDFTPFVHKYVHSPLRMVFDSQTESSFLNGIWMLNLAMKRLAVGFSFFHAGALTESMFFAHLSPKAAIKGFKLKDKQMREMISHPERFVPEHTLESIDLLKNFSFDDMSLISFMESTGLVFSKTGVEDIASDRFYNMMRQFTTTIRSGLNYKKVMHDVGVHPSKVEKMFKWFDKITWDKVFTHNKIFTWATSFDDLVARQLKNPKSELSLSLKAVKPKGVRSTEIILRELGEGASKFTNDAFGGLDWYRLAMDSGNPILQRLATTAFRPSSRGWLQLALFAPDWTIANIRIIAKSLPGFEKNPELRRLYQAYAINAALTYATIGTALNYIFSGHSQLDNTDPTRIDLGNGQVLTFSKQLMEPLHWITDPQKTAIRKIGSVPRTTLELLFNKEYLTTGWSPNIVKKDDMAIEKFFKLGGHAGFKFLPIWMQSAVRQIAQGYEREGLSPDLAIDTAVKFVIGQTGHPIYKGPRSSAYKLKGLAHDPMETLF